MSTMKTKSTLTKGEIETLLSLHRLFLRDCLAICGSVKSTPDATRVAADKAAEFKSVILELEEQLPKAA